VNKWLPHKTSGPEKAESKWRQVELHLKKGSTREDLDRFQREFLPYVGELLMSNMNIPFYFNRYFGEGEYCFLKLGVSSILDDDVFERILAKAVALGAEVKPGAPDLRTHVGMVVDDVKEMSARVAFDVFNLKKPSLQATALFIHFLLNQLGCTYNEELQVYLDLAHSIVRGGPQV